MLNRHRPFVAFVALIVTFSFCGLAVADENLPKDPNNVYGQFDNGVKYIIRRNTNPPGKVDIYLHVKTGSLNESPTQNGLAHFIEHMSFNGSTHFPPGELLPMMNKMGMVFGADSNAHTNYWETVYKLTMPDTSAKTIDTGMTIMQDFATGTLFTDHEIDEERGVILEESRSRKSAEERIQKTEFRTLFPGSQLATHDVIGDEDQIRHFPRSEFVDYWNAFYRPENMTLIVVGDINPDDIVKEGKEKLGSFKARADARTPGKAGITPNQTSKAYIFTDPDEVAGQVSLINLKPSRGIIKTFDQYRAETIDELAEWIVNRRFEELLQKGNAPFREASASSQDFFHEVLFVSADASGEPQDWNKMLDATIAEVNRAVDHGFTQREFDLTKKNALSAAERAVETESTRDSGQIVNMLAGSVGVERPIMSAPQRLDLLKKVLESVSLDDLHKAFVNNFKTTNYLYVLTMPEKKEGLTLPSTDDVMAAAKSAWMKKTDAPAEEKLASSLLTSQPTPGQVASADTDKDLEITTVKFANGVVMHHKFTNYKKDQISVQLTLPGGAIAETADNKGVSEVATLMLQHPATSKYTSSQIRDLMTGKKVHVGGGVGMDSLAMNISGSASDLDAGMQLAYAILTDGVLEQSALDEWKKTELQTLQRKKTDPQLQVFDAIATTIYGGDLRMAPMTEELINRQERSPAEAWFKHIASAAPIEVAVVGDIQLKDAEDLIAKYVGSLPQRSGEFTEYDALRKINRAPGPYETTQKFGGITPVAIVLAGFISCDELDPARRPLSLASLILSDRMIDRIREKEQLVYSIGCQNIPSRGIAGTGMMIAFAPCDPKNADKLSGEVIEMLKTFADKGPTDEEVTIAKKQMANQLDSQMKEPAFWLAQIAELEYRKRPLADLKQLPAIFQTFSASDIQGAVKKFLNDQSVLKIEVVPDSMAKGPTTAPSAEPAKGN